MQRLAHLGEHEIRHFLRSLARLVERHQGGELVSTEPRQLHVPRADLLEPTGHPLQQAIPRLVTIVVIDQLEVVQVHEHQGEAPPQAAVGLEGLHQAVAIEQAGEGVVPGQVTVFELLELAIRDVPHGQQDPGPLLDVAELILEPAHSLLGPALPLGHHLPHPGEPGVEGLIAAGENLGQLADAGAEAHVEMVVAALEAPLVVEQTGQGVTGGEGGFLIEGIGIDDRLRHHHLPSGELDAGEAQIDLFLDPLGGEGPPLVVTAILLKITEITLQQQIDGGGHVGRKVAGLQLGKGTRLPQSQGGVIGPVNVVTLDVIDPDGRMEHVHCGKQAFV
ncbi:hypothetical protein D3C79_359730 [compost metagenome]